MADMCPRCSTNTARKKTTDMARVCAACRKDLMSDKGKYGKIFNVLVEQGHIQKLEYGFYVCTPCVPKSPECNEEQWMDLVKHVVMQHYKEYIRARSVALNGGVRQMRKEKLLATLEAAVC